MQLKIPRTTNNLQNLQRFAPAADPEQAFSPIRDIITPFGDPYMLCVGSRQSGRLEVLACKTCHCSEDILVGKPTSQCTHERTAIAIQRRLRGRADQIKQSRT